MLVVNRAPTAGVPPKDAPFCDGDGPKPTAFTNRAAMPPLAGVAKMMASAASTEVLTRRADGLASQRYHRGRGRPDAGPGDPSGFRISGRIASLIGSLLSRWFPFSWH